VKPAILDVLEQSPEGGAAHSLEAVSRWMAAISLECEPHISPELDFACVMLSWDEVMQGSRAGRSGVLHISHAPWSWMEGGGVCCEPMAPRKRP
jgi:hypothetical protein